MNQSETEPEEKHPVQTLKDVLEKLAVKRITREFVWTSAGLTAGTGRFYRPDQLAITRAFVFENEPVPGASASLYIIRTEDDVVGYSLDRSGMPLGDKEQEAYRAFISRIPVLPHSTQAVFGYDAEPDDN